MQRGLFSYQLMSRRKWPPLVCSSSARTRRLASLFYRGGRKLIRIIAQNANRALAPIKHVGKIEILVLGDSHAEVFRHRDVAPPGYYFKIVSVGGATISGLQNPNSATQALPIFEKAIKRSKGEICVTLLGEVDTGFVIWYRANKHDFNVAEVLEQTVNRYIEFIEKIPREKHVLIMSTPLPTIQDGQEWGEIADARREITASQRQRTELTLQLNQSMKRYAKGRGVMFIDLDARSLGKDGLVDPDLLNANQFDHHYDVEKYIKLFKPDLIKCIEHVRAGHAAPRHVGCKKNVRAAKKTSGLEY